MIGTTTVFKNDKFFEGDVVMRTEVSTQGTYISIELIVIPTDVNAVPYGGAMVWELAIEKGNLETNEEVFEAIKRDEYRNYGCSEIVDVIDRA